MKKIKAFLYVFIKSLTSIKYYEEVVKTNTSFSMKYFLVVAFLASVIATIGIVVPNISKMDKEIRSGLEQANNMYPASLEVTAKEGKLSINQPEPYFIPAPKSFSEGEKPEDVPTNLIVFDSKGTLDNVTKYNTIILVNQSNVLAKSKNKIEAYPMGDMPNGTLTRVDIDKFIVILESYVKYVPYVMAIFVFVGMVFHYGIFRIFYLLVVGLVLWIVGRVRDMNFTYDKYFKIAIHTFTLPLVLDLIIRITGITLEVPFWFFPLNAVFGIIVIVSLHKAEKKPIEQ